MSESRAGASYLNSLLHFSIVQSNYLANDNKNNDSNNNGTI